LLQIPWYVNELVSDRLGTFIDLAGILVEFISTIYWKIIFQIDIG